MIKIRVMGPTSEVEKAVRDLGIVFRLNSVSSMLPNEDEPGVRVYITATLKKGARLDGQDAEDEGV